MLELLLLALVTATLLGLALLVWARRRWLKVAGSALLLAVAALVWVGYAELRAADRYIAMCLDQTARYYSTHKAFHPECGDIDAFR